MDIHIRPAHPDDAPAIVGFQISMAQETEGVTLDRPTVERGVAGLFEQPQRGQYFVAEHDGQTIGCVLVLPEWSDWRNGTVLWLHSVYIAPEHRGRGVFGRLYRHLAAMVEAEDTLKGLRLYVERGNHAAQAVYRRLGMTDEHYALFEWLKT